MVLSFVSSGSLRRCRRKGGSFPDSGELLRCQLPSASSWSSGSFFSTCWPAVFPRDLPLGWFCNGVAPVRRFPMKASLATLEGGVYSKLHQCGSTGTFLPSSEQWPGPSIPQKARVSALMGMGSFLGALSALRVVAIPLFVSSLTSY